MTRLLALIPVSLLLGMLTGCQLFSSTQIESVSSSRPEAAVMKKVLVLGINTTPEIQKAMEQAFSQRLSVTGNVVVLSSDWFPGEHQPGREQIAARCKAEGVTGVLVTRLINYEVSAVQEKFPEFSLYTPARIPGERVGWQHDSWVAGFESAQQIRATAPLLERKAIVQTRLYNAATDAVVWEADSKIFLERDAGKNFDSFVSAIMTQLKKSGWL
jgi:hypothetical protein